ncbi:hypothetical protein DH2020_036013 [Rehmannia glutinosa]|uniref:XS domain-containing protein n=1 Tax=Rehmannia glutinosa TaxID=99300 RepID=A0ABR0V6J0_REHGL
MASGSSSGRGKKKVIFSQNESHINLNLSDDEVEEQELNEMFNTQDSSQTHSHGSSNPKMRKNRSDMFVKFFDKVKLQSGEQRAQCKFCEKSYKFQQGGGYGTLKKHVEKKHPVEYGISPNQTQMQGYVSSVQPGMPNQPAIVSTIVVSPEGFFFPDHFCGNPPKPPPSSFSAHSHHRNSRRDSAASASATVADRKPSATTKSKPSPSSTTTPPNNKDPNNKDPNNKPPTPKPKPRPENPSPRPENPNAISGPRPVFPLNDPPPPPSYGFHMLDRRSIVLADGSVRSYFALPPEYENFTNMHRPGLRPEFMGRHEFGLERPPLPMSPGFLGPDGRTRNPEHWKSGPDNSLKRKFGEDERGGRDDGFERQRQQLLQYGNANGPGPSVGYNLGRGEDLRAPKNMRFLEGNSSKPKHSEVDQNALKKAFLHFVKMVFETASQRNNLLADGKQGPLPCLACGSSDNADSIVDHLAFHKALCVLMGWNYLIPPDNSKAYQKFSAADAEANLDDLIMWPPSVLIHNTITGKGRDGRMEGIGNRAMDSMLRDLGVTNGKSMSLYAREGHLGMHTVKFPGDESGLKEAMRLSDYFEREKRGRKSWARVQPLTLGKDDDNNPNLVKLDPKTGEKKRVFYGHLATVVDLDKVTFEIKKRVSIVSAREFFKQSK